MNVDLTMVWLAKTVTEVSHSIFLSLNFQHLERASKSHSAKIGRDQKVHLFHVLL